MKKLSILNTPISKLEPVSVKTRKILLSKYALAFGKINYVINMYVETSNISTFGKKYRNFSKI